MIHPDDNAPKNQHPDPESDRFLDPREAAAMCCVSEDTVTGWIREGKLPAVRGPKDRYRIRRADLNRFMLDGGAGPIERDEPGFFQYCWEHYSQSGEIGPGCTECVVYRTRNGRCYEIAALSGETGHARSFCKNTCDECDYYKKVKGARPGVLAVTCDAGLKSSLRKAVERAGLEFRSIDCEYRCLMLLDRFLPDFVIIDTSLGNERSRDFAEMLHADTRVPYVKIILIDEPGRLPSECDKRVFAIIRRRFRFEEIERLLKTTTAGI